MNRPDDFSEIDKALAIEDGQVVVNVRIKRRRRTASRLAAALAQSNCVTGASKRNWASYSESITLPSDLPEWGRDLLTDPQTSGGLLIACERADAAKLSRMIANQGCPSTRVIGNVEVGPPSVLVKSRLADSPASEANSRPVRP